MPIGIPRVRFLSPEDELEKKRKRQAEDESPEPQTEGQKEDRNRDKDTDKNKDKLKDKKNNEIWVDLYTRLYHERVLFLFGELTPQLSNSLIGLLTYFSIRDPKKEFSLFINSMGGGLRNGVALYNTMQHVTPDINTVCLGSAYSMGAFILAGGANQKRMATPRARIMLHEPHLRLSRLKVSDLLFDVGMMKDFTWIVISELAKRTGKSESTIHKDLKKETFMSPKEAQIHGIIDYIISREKKKEDPILLTEE